jgi:hypothetical protein
MTFAGRSEQAKTACPLARFVACLRASHRPRGLRCQALVLAVPRGAHRCLRRHCQVCERLRVS